MESNHYCNHVSLFCTELIEVTIRKDSKMKNGEGEEMLMNNSKEIMNQE